MQALSCKSLIRDIGYDYQLNQPWFQLQSHQGGMSGVALSSTSIDALLNFDQEIIQKVVHKTLPAPRECRTSSGVQLCSSFLTILHVASALVQG